MKKNTVKEILSESGAGTLSSKRVIGTIVSLICMICITYLVVSEGGTTVVENLLQTAMIMSASLLGLGSITGAWGKGAGVSISHDPFATKEGMTDEEKMIMTKAREIYEKYK